MPKRKPRRPSLDDYLSCKQAAPHVPPDGVHWMSIYRWGTRGVKVGRRVVKLRTIRTTNRRLTTLRWLNEFLAALQDDEASHEELLAPNRDSVARQLDAELAS